MTRAKKAPKQGARARVLVLADEIGDTVGILKELLDCGMSFVSEAQPIKEAIRSIEKFQPDIVLLDLHADAMDPLFMIKHIRARFPDKPLLLFSPMADPLFAARVLRAGARGYLTRTDVPHSMIKAIRELLGGRRFVSEQPLQGILHGLGQVSSSPEEALARRLSDRELVIFRFLGQGHNPYQIAKELNVSIKTVLTHRSNMKRKLQLSSLQDLVFAARSFVAAEMQASKAPFYPSGNAVGNSLTAESGARPIARRVVPPLP